MQKQDVMWSLQGWLLVQSAAWRLAHRAGLAGCRVGGAAMVHAVRSDTCLSVPQQRTKLPSLTPPRVICDQFLRAGASVPHTRNVLFVDCLLGMRRELIAASADVPATFARLASVESHCGSA